MKQMTGVQSVERDGGFEPLDPGIMRSAAQRVQEVLPLPAVVNAILKAANNPYASLSQVADTVLRDQALTARVLKLINSSFYCLPQRVGTVSQAVSLLGLEKIKHLAMAISLADGLFRWSGLPCGRKALWHHSQACGVATSLVVQAAGIANAEEALIAGLLHDIGKVLWAEVFPERYLATLQAIKEEGLDPPVAEKRFLGVPHPRVGAWMLEAWDLPPLFAQAVLGHHMLEGAGSPAPAHFLSRALYLGDLLVRLLNLGDGGHNHLDPVPPSLLKTLHLNPSQVVEILRELPRAFAAFIADLELEPPELGLLKKLDGLLKERRLWVIDGPDNLPAPGWALASLTSEPAFQTLPLSGEQLQTESPLVFWAGVDPAPILSAWREAARASPQASLLIFLGSRGKFPAGPCAGLPRLQVLGPEWRLEELSRALTPAKRPRES